MARNYTSYIESMYNQYGENWVGAMRPEDIQRSSKRLIKEIARGQINYEKFGNYFLDAKFLDNVIIALKNELEVNTLYYNAVYYYRSAFPNVPNITTHENHLACLCYIYITILQRLQCVKETGNIGVMSDISALLFSYKNHLQ